MPSVPLLATSANTHIAKGYYAFHNDRFVGDIAEQYRAIITVLSEGFGLRLEPISFDHRWAS